MTLLESSWLRMAGALLVCLVLALALYLTSPPPGQMDFALWRVDLHKLSLAAAGAWMGYWFDRWSSPYARPDCFLVGGRDAVFAAAMQRRAIIQGATIICIGLAA
ncbi:MAG: putative holin [Sterolibacterium sp.]|nr:putative holin [Sterolibacterium sp.]